MQSPFCCGEVTISRRCYSQFPPQYQLPIERKEELAQPLDENDPRRFLPIRPAKDDACPHVLNDPVVSKLIQIMMKDGRKQKVREIVMQAFELIKRKQLKLYWSAQTDEERASIVCDPVAIFHQAMKNVAPILWLIPISRGGIIYQVPVPITEKRGYFRAYQFIRDAAADRERHRDRKFMAYEKLATDILDAYNNTGLLIKKKQDLYRVCEANKTYASYRWAKR